MSSPSITGTISVNHSTLDEGAVHVSALLSIQHCHLAMCFILEEFGQGPDWAKSAKRIESPSLICNGILVFPVSTLAVAFSCVKANPWLFLERSVWWISPWQLKPKPLTLWSKFTFQTKEGKLSLSVIDLCFMKSRLILWFLKGLSKNPSLKSPFHHY